MKQSKNYSNEYKFKLVLEMIRGDLTIAEIISKYQVPRSVLHRWKKQLLDNGANVFASSKTTSSSEFNQMDIDKLHAIIGRLKVENDFLQQVSARVKL